MKRDDVIRINLNIIYVNYAHSNLKGKNERNKRY